MPGQPLKGNYLFLLVGLSVLLVSYPAFLELETGIGLIAIQVATSVTLLISVWSLIETRVWFVFGLCLAGSMLALTVIGIVHDSTLISHTKIAVSFLFFTQTLLISFRHVVFSKRIDWNRIVGAICIYILIGILWSLGYTIVEILSPGSFNGLNNASTSHQNFDLLYFSFITLTTLGYGDIAPLKPTARTLAYFEAIVGQFYLAIMVAGLVASYIGDRQKFEAGDCSKSKSAPKKDFEEEEPGRNHPN